MRHPFLALAAVLFAIPALAAPPPPYARHVCANGLEVLVAERHAAPLVTVEIGVHNGAMTEPPEYSGLSHLYEHMFFKGNAALPDQTRYFARSRELGVSWNGTTAVERVNYFFTTTSDHLADVMTFMRDAITSPLFDTKELERERVVVTGEMDRNEAEPTFNLWRAMTQRVFWKYPSRREPLGSRKTVLATTPQKMRTIQERYYVPNNSVLVVTGDVKADDVFAQADRLYASWAKAADPFVRFPLVHHPPIARSEVVIVPQPVQTFHGKLEWQGPSTGDASVEDTYAADLVGEMVGEPGSKLQRALVDSGACVRAGLHWSTMRNVGEITFDFESTEEKAEECTRAALAELPKIREADYFADDEMRGAARLIEVDEAGQRETTDGYAHLLTYEWAMASLDYYATYQDRVRAVTRADVARYLDTYVLGKPFVFGVVESPKLATAMSRARLEGLAGIGAAPAKKGGKP